MEVVIQANPLARKQEIAGGRLLPMVFDNLLRNSAQFTETDVKVLIAVTREKDYVQIDVSDDGPGIPKGIQSKLFERGTSTKGGGLGLYLSKRVIEHYGGSIEVLPNQKSKKGALFRIKLKKVQWNQPPFVNSLKRKTRQLAQSYLGDIRMDKKETLEIIDKQIKLEMRIIDLVE